MSTTTTTPTSTPTPVTSGGEERVQQHLRALADDAEALLKATARAGDEKFDAARERLRDELHHLRTRIVDLEHNAAARVKTAAHQTDQAVHTHPYAAMGVAAAAGVLLGFLLGRR